MDYRVLLARSAQKQLDEVPREEYRRIYESLKSLSASPRPRGCVKLADDLYRIRCGAYRVLYSVLDKDQAVLIVKVARRSEKTYRDLP